MKITWRYFVRKIINTGLDLLELFEHIIGVRNFLRHSVYASCSLQVKYIIYKQTQKQEKQSGWNVSHLSETKFEFSVLICTINIFTESLL